MIKKTIPPIMRITVSKDGAKELKGTLRISHMIPVPASELEFVDMDHEPDTHYKDLLITELSFIRRNADKIMKYAHTMYILKHNQTTDSPTYVKTALDYKALEILCDAFQQ